MASTADWAERRDGALQELSELGMALARDMAARAQAAETLAEAERCAALFERLSRSVRLTFALQSRLERDDRQMRREEVVDLSKAGYVRKKQVRAAIARAIPAEVPDSEYERLLRELDRHLDEATLYEDFAKGPLAACIARIRRELDLPPEEAANDAAASFPLGLAATGPP